MKEIREATSSPKPASLRRLSTLQQQIEIYQAQISDHRQKVEDLRSQLRESYARYDELYELAPVGFLTLDRQGRIRELNEKAARLLAFPSGWLIDRPFVVFVAKEYTRGFLSFLTRAVHHTELQTTELDLFVDHRRLPVQISMRTSTHDDRVVHRMTVVDLTDTRKTQKQLQESLDNWHSLVHNAPDVIMTLNRKGRIVFVNRPVWGCSIRALLGTYLVDYVPQNEQSRLRQCIEDVFSSEGRTTCEISGLNGDTPSWYSFTFGAVQNADGHSDPDEKTTTLMIREISEHKRAEETLRSSEEQLREFAARLEAVREEERARVAREIHDELGQALTVLKLDLSWLNSKTKTRRTRSETRKKLNSMIVYVDDTIARVRQIASELRPSILDDLGLIPAIEWQLSEFQKRTGIRCQFRPNVTEADLGSEKSAAIFRVVQEALTNVMRHAKASTVRVSLNTEANALRIFVEDDGKGITEEEMKDMKSLGIVGMKERISRLGGEFKIQSGRGKGTRLDIILPGAQ